MWEGRKRSEARWRRYLTDRSLEGEEQTWPTRSWSGLRAVLWWPFASQNHSRAWSHSSCYHLRGSPNMKKLDQNRRKCEKVTFCLWSGERLLNYDSESRSLKKRLINLTVKNKLKNQHGKIIPSGSSKDKKTSNTICNHTTNKGLICPIHKLVRKRPTDQ